MGDLEYKVKLLNLIIEFCEQNFKKNLKNETSS